MAKEELKHILLSFGSRPSSQFRRRLKELINTEKLSYRSWLLVLGSDYVYSLLTDMPRILREESCEELLDSLYRLAYLYALESRDRLAYLVSCAGMAYLKRNNIAEKTSIKMKMLHMMTAFEMGYAAETLRWYRSLKRLGNDIVSELDENTRFQLYNNLGLVSKLFTREDPMVFYKKAMGCADTETKAAMVQMNIANHLYDERDYGSALELAKQVEKIAEDPSIRNSPYIKGNALICQLKILLQTGDIERAHSIVAKLEQLSESNNDWLDEPIAQVFLGHYYVEVGDFRRAERYLQFLESASALAKTKYLEGESLVLNASILNKSGNKFQALEKLVKAFEYLGVYKTVSPHLRDFVTNLLQSIIGIFRDLIHDLEQKDNYTALHTLRVSKISYAVGKALGLSKVELFYLALGAMLHDYGKVDIPTEILNKPAELTEKEFDIVRRHPEMGSHYLEDLAFPEEVRNIVLSHHERNDGLGYPKGLRNGEISLLVQIVAICDVYDALTTDRPYRLAQMKDKAMAYLQEQGETIVEPFIFEAFASVLLDSEYETALDEFESVWYEILFGLFLQEKNGAFAPRE